MRLCFSFLNFLFKIAIFCLHFVLKWSTFSKCSIKKESFPKKRVFPLEKYFSIFWGYVANFLGSTLKWGKWFHISSKAIIENDLQKWDFFKNHFFSFWGYTGINLILWLSKKISKHFLNKKWCLQKIIFKTRKITYSKHKNKWITTNKY